MNRVYGDHVCSACGHIPEIGWLYACQQDDQPARELPPPLTLPSTLPDGISYFEAMAQLAEHIQIGSSVVRGIRAGDYSSQQVIRLLKQKEELIDVIRTKEKAAVERVPASVRFVDGDSSDIISSVGASPPMQGDSSLAATMDITTANRDMTTSPMDPLADSSASKSTRQTEKLSTKKRLGANCTYKVCQTCRPNFQDRMYSSFEVVLYGEVPPLSDTDLRYLPVMDSAVALNFGIRQPATHASFESISKDITMCDLNDTDDDISVDWTPTEGGDSFSQHLNNAELYPCPGPHQCPVYSRYSGCAYDTGFDDGQRAANHGFSFRQERDRITPEDLRYLNMIDTSSTASSLSLPTPTSTSLNPLLSTDEAFASTLKKKLGKARSSDFPRTTLRTRESNSSFGSEVEVQGGVALTEESVGRGVPDILNID